MTDTSATVVCKHCRRELPDEARYCPGCGYTTRQERGDILKPIGLMLLMFGALLLIIGSRDED